MEAISSFFGFQTPVGERIDKATSEANTSEDWATILEVCDMVQADENGPRDAVRAIRKRLSSKNQQVLLYALTVLETLVKNCGQPFHNALANKDLMADLVKIVQTPKDYGSPVREKILILLQSWFDAFRGKDEMLPVIEAYRKLKREGVDFPATDLDAMAPIYTPAQTHTVARSEPVPVAQPQSAPVVSSEPLQRVKPTEAQLAKLNSELDIVRNNNTVLKEMLDNYDGSGSELLKELYTTCKEMQSRLLELLEQVADDAFVGVLLSVNDELNTTFAKYDSRVAQAPPAGLDTQPY
eukprot:Colp12_sorted_trinity150504_noHs@27465